ncbi:hypothetical protein FB451DRAFT_1455527 [Mycena latifolia]|nr:hypothetical protein FB451DRAFT_1455527 [Mycena latifolia]
MTEYDYSPEAYQRHFETQARIARWAQATHQVPQKDPFAPPTPANGPAPLPREASRSSRRTRSSDRDRDRERRRSPPPPLPLPRDAPPRSQTAPPQHLYPAVVQPYYPAAPPPPPTQTQNQHRRARSSSQAPTAPPLQPTRSRSYSVAHPHAAPMPARGLSYPPPTANYPPLPPGYVYAQPQPQYAQPAPVYAQYAQPQPMRSPTREVPLLKRMFGFGGGGSKGLSRESSRSREGSGGRRTPRRQETY